MKKRVLLINCGMMVATYINTELKNNDEFELWGSSTYENHGKYIFENYIDSLPNMNEENFIEVLNNIIKEYNFKFIMAEHDDLVLFLQENKEKINATIVSSDYETALLSRYKSKTYEKLKKYDFIPKTYKPNEVKSFPVFIKKDNDQGARHAYKIEDEKQLELYITSEPNMIICEYLPGEEVGIDCFTDKNRNLLFCNPRVVENMLAGIDIHARRIKITEEIKHIAEILNKEINFRGNWFFQIKKDKNGKFKLLEIASRLSSSFGINRSLDVNLPLMALKDFDNQNVNYLFNQYADIEVDQQFFARYILDIKYNEVYIDFESCFKEKIDTSFIMYLYQCVNKNKKINLLTENKDIAIKYLKNKKISENLFDNIIQIDQNNVKQSIEKDSILLSNNDKLKNCFKDKIYCYSTNDVELLLDWKS